MKTPKYDYLPFMAEVKLVREEIQRTEGWKRIEFDLAMIDLVVKLTASPCKRMKGEPEKAHGLTKVTQQIKGQNERTRAHVSHL